MENMIGVEVKGYQFEERIGAGGFGAVYRAKQSAVGREVAIKVILPKYANQPDFIRRFEAEAQLVARLEHLHIAPLYDYWRNPDGAYLVMRLMRGGSVHQALKNGSYDLESAALLLDQIAGALDIAHRNNVVHRDIKPPNVLLDEDGNAYLTDFGIAKDLENNDQSLTAPDALVGSPDYLAPEQARSEPVTPQTDIYSLGVLMYEILAGAHPFAEALSVERIFKHLNEPLPLLTEFESEVNEQINAVIQKATAKRPDQRYEDVLKMAAAFREAAGLSVSKVARSIVELLTPREQEVLKYTIEGKTNREISDLMVVEVTTVKWYIKQIYKKLNVRSRVQAIVKARELNLIVSNQLQGASNTTSISHLPEPENPYKGLFAFQAADEQNFFGRERLVEKLLTKMTTGEEYSRFLAVVGPSGSGKSSLVKAGLIPALWRGQLPGSEKWFVVEMSPGTRPLDELEVALTRMAAEQGTNMGEHIRRDTNGLLRAAQLILPKDGSELLVIVDQFEEVFTLVENEEARQYFLDLLSAAVNDRKSKVRVVITLRADFYDRPLQYAAFGELMRNRVETVLPLSAEELERAIVQPALQVGVEYEDGLVASITDDVLYQPGALPLLQYALTELFETREQQLLTHAGYQKIGRAVGALGKQAETIFSELAISDQGYVRQMFLRLVTLGEGVEDTRRVVSQIELMEIADNPDRADEIIETFSAFRLLSLDIDPLTRNPTIQVAHEALLREWDRLREWLSESRTDIRLQRQLAYGAQDWRTGNNDVSFLLRGSRLEQFEGWRGTTDLALTQIEGDYLDASLALQVEEETAEVARQANESKLEQRTQRVLQVLVAVFAVATVISIFLANFAFKQQEQAQQNANLAAVAQEGAVVAQEQAVNEAELAVTAQAEAEKQTVLAQEWGNLAFSRELSQLALNNLSTDPELSILLALQALDTSFTKEAEEALHFALQTSRTELTLIGHEGFVGSVVYLSDGSRLATAGMEDGTIKIWDTATGAELLSWTYVGVFSEIGGRLIYDAPNNLLSLLTKEEDSNELIFQQWNAQTGELETQINLPVALDPQSDYDFSPQRGQAAIGYENGSAEIWDIFSGERLVVLPAMDDWAWGIKFSPDGTRLAVSNPTILTVWDVAASVDAGVGQLIDTVVPVVENEEILGVTFFPDNSRLLLTFSSGFTEAYDLDHPESPMFSTDANTNALFAAAINPAETMLATTDLGGINLVWDITAGEAEFIYSLDGHQSAINEIDFSPDGKHLATASQDGTVRIWDAQPAADGELFTRPDIPNSMDIAISPDQNLVALGSRFGPALVLDFETGEILHTLAGDPDTGVYRVDFHPDGSQLASVGEDNVIRVWDVKTGAMLMNFVGHEAGGNSGGFFAGTIDVSYSPDGTRLATAGTDGIAKVWDAETGTELLTLAGHTTGLHSLAYSPNGKFIATSSDEYESSVKVWDAETGAEIYNFLGHPTRVWGLAFSPDNTVLATGGGYGVVKVWDLVTGEEMYTLPSHVRTVNSIIFTPDGKKLITVGEVTRIWDVETGTELLTLASVRGRLALSANGEYLYIFSGGAMGVYTLDIADTIALAESRLTRDLTTDECQRYLHVDICP